MSKYTTLAFLIFCLCSCMSVLQAQNGVAINTSGASADSSAILDVQSTTKGILVPRMDSTQRTMISNAAPGLLVYDTDTESFWFRDSGDWTELVSSSRGLRDVDQDTRVEVEASPDEDTIRFVVAGSEMALMDGKTFHLKSPGNSLFIGSDAGINDDGSSNNNVFVGPQAGMHTTTGSNNVMMGNNAGLLNTSGNGNTMIGNDAGVNNTTGMDNVMVGNNSGPYNETGKQNIFVGTASGFNNISGDHNIAIGFESLYSNTSGNDNIAIGKAAMTLNLTGTENTAIGSWALSQSVEAHDNTAVGYEALASTSIGERNTAVGHHALFQNVLGNDNCAFGVNALENNSTGENNVAAGFEALKSNTTGYYNVAIGTSALHNNTTGGINTAVGGIALYNNTTGTHNVALGLGAMVGSETGSENIAIGYETGRFNNGNMNVMIGHEAGRGTGSLTTNKNVFLGYQAGYNETGSSKLYIETSSSSSPLIYGDFQTNVVGINGSLGIGTQSPAHPLDVRKNGTDSVQTIVGMLQSTISRRPLLLFSENSSNDLTSGMSIEYNGIGIGGNNEMYINKVGGEPMVTFESSGEVGIGTINPETRLHIAGGTDSGLSGGGYLTIGETSDKNLSFDNNEIMARFNGTTTPLHLQVDGGGVSIGTSTNDSKVNIRSAVGENPLRARIEGATKFVVHSNGGSAIGVNATPPPDGLHVAGNIRMNGTEIVSTDTLRLQSNIRIELLVGAHSVVIDPVTGITITSGNDITFDAANNINLISGGIIDLDAAAELKLTSGDEMDINCGKNLEIDALMEVDIDSDSFVRLQTEGNSSAGAARVGSNVNVPPCSTGCTGSVTSGSAIVLIGY